MRVLYPIAGEDLSKLGFGWRHGLGTIGCEEFHVSLLLIQSRARPLLQVCIVLDFFSLLKF